MEESDVVRPIRTQRGNGQSQSAHGAASLLDFLNAQADYRNVEVNYVNLIDSYLKVASQLSLAAGHEVFP